MCFCLSLVHHSLSPNPSSLSHPTLTHSFTQPLLTLSPNPYSLSHPTLTHSLTQPFLTLSPNPSSLSHPTLPHSLPTLPHSLTQPSLTLTPNPPSLSHPTLPHSHSQPSLTVTPNPPSPFPFHTAPLAPRNLTLEVTSSQSINVSWTRPLFFRGQLLQYKVCMCLDV